MFCVIFLESENQKTSEYENYLYTSVFTLISPMNIKHNIG